jgi:hypothetical protein
MKIAECVCNKVVQREGEDGGRGKDDQGMFERWSDSMQTQTGSGRQDKWQRGVKSESSHRAECDDEADRAG